MTIGFLYSEVMGYTEACFKKLLELEVNLVVIHWDKLLKTPYKLCVEHPRLKYFKSSELSERQCIEILIAENIQGLYVSGWMDRKYVRVARYFKRTGIKVIAGCDTSWNGSLKHHIAGLVGRRWLHRSFDELLIAGAPQLEFGKRIGFRPTQISWPEYACDVGKFRELYLRNRERKISKTIVFVGRFNKVKGILPLVEAFLKIKKEDSANAWRLRLIGNGPLQNSIVKKADGHTDVSIHNFMQPSELIDDLQNTGVFCLPSLVEPWGVVVHEFAVAGFPLVLSDACGSSFHFLKSGYNGYLFPFDNSLGLELALSKIMQMSEKELKQFGERSHWLGIQLTPLLWAENLISRFK